MRSIAPRRWAALALGLALLCAAPGVRAAQPYTLTVLLPLTGYGAFFGIPQIQTLKAIEALVNRTGGIKGTPIHFEVKDDQTNPQVDVQLASQVFAEHVPVLLGPDTTGQCNAVTPLAAKNGPVVFCFTPSAHPPAGGYVFASGTATQYVTQAIVRYFSDHGFKRVAVLSTTDATGQDGDRAFADVIGQDPKLTLVDRQYYGVSDVSVSAQLAHIKATHPDILAVVATGTPFGTFLRSFQSAGLNVPIMASSGNLLYGELKQYASVMPSGLLFANNVYLDPQSVTDPGTKTAIATLDRELAALGAKPDQGHNSNWDATIMVIDALRKYGTGATAEQIKDYIANLNGWAGIDGRYDFRAEPQRGLGESSVVILRYDPRNESFHAVSGPGGSAVRGR